MIIKSISGTNIIQTGHKTMQATLEYCVRKGISLAGADLRKAKCRRAALDGLKARGACLWGADLRGADIGLADLRHADLRCADLKDTCLAESDLSDADLQGAYFAGTLIDGALLNRAIVSCPSFWGCDLRTAAGFEGLIYNHLGERKIKIDAAPLVIHGLEKRMMLAAGICLWGRDVYTAGSLPLEALQSLFTAKTSIERAMISDVLQPATNLSRR